MIVHLKNENLTPMNVEVVSKPMANEYGSFKFKMNQKACLQPNEESSFEIDAPHGCVPSIRYKENNVVITFIDPDKVNMS
jgi:hypothetical protein